MGKTIVTPYKKGGDRRVRSEFSVCSIKKGCAGRSEYSGLSALCGGHVVGIDEGDVLRRGAQARAQPGRRVRRQTLLEVFQRRLERTDHAQLQPTQLSTRAHASHAARPHPAADPNPTRVWCGCFARDAFTTRPYSDATCDGPRGPALRGVACKLRFRY